jgi:hypothetical protein
MNARRALQLVLSACLLLPTGLQAQEKFDCADAFHKAEELFNSYLSINLKSLKSERRLEKQVDRKKTAYEWVEAAYNNIIKNCGPIRSVTSHYRLGCAAENFAYFYIEAPLPPTPTPEQKNLYKSLLNEKAMPYLEKAKSEFEASVKLSEKEKVRSKYVELSRKKLEEIKERIKDAHEFVRVQKKLEEEMMAKVEPERKKRLAQARKKKLDEAWERAKAEGGVLPPSKLEGDKIPFVLIPVAIDPSVENKVKLFGMDFSDVRWVDIGKMRVKSKKISKYTLEIVIPAWLGQENKNVYGAWDIMITFNDKKRRPIIFGGGLWVGKKPH